MEKPVDTVTVKTFEKGVEKDVFEVQQYLDQEPSNVAFRPQPKISNKRDYTDLMVKKN